MAEKIEELRKRTSNIVPIPEEKDFHLQDETLVRYLKAREWKVEEAEKALRATVEYRRIHKPLHADCTWCNERPGYHSMRQVGFDEGGRPVMYSSFVQATVHRYSVEDSVSHITYILENAKRCMGPGISTYVWVIDCTGMTVTACNPKLGRGVSDILANHYPETLGLVICINHNPVFQGIWNATKVFLHSSTVAKTKLVRSKSKILKLFQKYFSEELTEWLLDEVKENKKKPLPVSQREFWNKPSQPGGHDPRGCQSYVSKYIEHFDSSRDNNKHKPHPNILNHLHGKKQEVIISEHEENERTRLAQEAEAESIGSEEELDVDVIDKQAKN